jgi:oxygen-independent coproporphyrinogen III oxidase
VQTDHAELVRRFDRPGPRYTSDPTAVHFTDDFGPSQYEEALRRADEVADPWSIYAHLPFCAARCLFCACTTVISPDATKVVGYLDELSAEIDRVAALLPKRRDVAQLHLGGGTPTYFEPRLMASLLDHLLERFPLTADAEFSVEVDPRVTTPQHIDEFAKRGMNRISLGVQDTNPRVQQAVRRVQPMGRVIGCVNRARQAGTRSVNVDLIYGLPHQTAEGFRATVHEVIDSVSPDRLAVYGFAYVPWLKGHQKKLPTEALPGPDARLDLQNVAREVLTEAGYVDIGMDHYALPDDELAVAQREGRLWRNFMGYTTQRSADMLGLGLSAIGYVGNAFVQNTRKLSDWRTLIAGGGLAAERGIRLSDDDLLRQRVIQELMCNFRVDKRAVESEFQFSGFDTVFSDAREALKDAEDAGLIVWDDDAVRATEVGKLFVRNLAMPFDRYLKTETKARYSQTV